MQTAKAVSAPAVSARIVREWGEALWTAPDLVDAVFQAELRTTAVLALFGLPR